jgi:hypothetical protein
VLPDIVAVKVCDWEVVTAAIPGASETLPPPEPLPEPLPDPGVELVEFPPQEISPGDNRAKAKASNRI